MRSENSKHEAIDYFKWPSALSIAIQRVLFRGKLSIWSFAASYVHTTSSICIIYICCLHSLLSTLDASSLDTVLMCIHENEGFLEAKQFSNGYASDNSLTGNDGISAFLNIDVGACIKYCIDCSGFGMSESHRFDWQVMHDSGSWLVLLGRPPTHLCFSKRLNCKELDSIFRFFIHPNIQRVLANQHIEKVFAVSRAPLPRQLVGTLIVKRPYGLEWSLFPLCLV